MRKPNTTSRRGLFRRRPAGIEQRGNVSGVDHIRDRRTYPDARVLFHDVSQVGAYPLHPPFSIGRPDRHRRQISPRRRRIATKTSHLIAEDNQRYNCSAVIDIDYTTPHDDGDRPPVDPVDPAGRPDAIDRPRHQSGQDLLDCVTGLEQVDQPKPNHVLHGPSGQPSGRFVRDPHNSLRQLPYK
jgi:hypothetical protein